MTGNGVDSPTRRQSRDVMFRLGRCLISCVSLAAFLLANAPPGLATSAHRHCPTCPAIAFELFSPAPRACPHGRAEAQRRRKGCSERGGACAQGRGVPGTRSSAGLARSARASSSEMPCPCCPCSHGYAFCSVAKALCSPLITEAAAARPAPRPASHRGLRFPAAAFLRQADPSAASLDRPAHSNPHPNPPPQGGREP